MILENIKDIKGVVTADCDGQHSSEDIINVGLSFSKNCELRLVLGAREFNNDVPFRSKFGNLMIRSLFRLQTGKFIVDTQTGLRAIPRTFLNTCVKIPTNSYMSHLLFSNHIVSILKKDISHLSFMTFCHKYFIL